jgi:hypothetical protein
MTFLMTFPMTFLLIFIVIFISGIAVMFWEMSFFQRVPYLRSSGDPCITSNRNLVELESLHSTSYLAKLSKSQTFSTERKKFHIVVEEYDSISRKKFQLLFPQTHSYLTTDNARVNIEMSKFNIVGYNSNPNQYGMLTGYPWDWQNDLERIENFEHPHWARIANKMGFVSASASDDCYAKVHCKGVDFTTSCCGDQRVYQTSQACGETPAFLLDQQHAMCKTVPSENCAAPVHFKFMKNVISNSGPLSSSPKFIFAQTTKGHTPNGGTVQNFDKPLKEMIQTSSSTIYIICGDHGWHGNGAKSQEHRNPMLWFSFPKSFAETYPKIISNLENNQKVLITPYDLHETVHELMSVITGKSFKPKSPNGISFVNKIWDIKRTCDDANVPKHWCLDVPTKLKPAETYLKLDPYIYQCSGREKSAGANFPGYDWGRPSPRRCGLPCNNMYCENEPVVSGNDDKTKSFWDGGPSKS